MLKRRRFAACLKKKVAIEALREQKTINEIASEYKISPSQISKWKKELLDGAEQVFSSNKNKSLSSNQEKKEAELHQKIGQLTVENDWLKKKLNR